MTTLRREGRPVTLELPSHVQVIDDGQPHSVPRRDTLSSSVHALGDLGGWDLVDSFELVSSAPEIEDQSVVEAADADDSVVQVRVDAASDQRAAVLTVDRDGVYRWLKENRGSSAGVPVFDVAPTDRATAGGGLRGSVNGLRAWVFRFVADILVPGVVAIQEFGIREELVEVTAGGPDGWDAISGPISAETKDGTVRILLLVHGIFATTKFTFNSMVTQSGGAFLTAAGRKYDAVLGFDHKTLSVDPKENAETLRRLLLELSHNNIEVDVIAHSRGSLVTRSLVEQVLQPDDPIAVDTVVMAGGPNNGTQIAVADNWDTFVDAITNLLIAFDQEYGDGIPPWFLTRLAELVKVVVREGVEGEHVPGLAAMAPGSEYLGGLNSGTGPPMGTGYRAVSADFEPTEMNPAPAWALRLALVAADLATDALLTVSNDLAVDVASMARIDSATLGGTDVFAVPTALGVHHLSYFCKQAVVEMISDWLDLT